jgi:spore germination protein YaaH/putative cell wall-binding protein
VLSATTAAPALAADPSGLPPLPDELQRPSVQAEMATEHAADELALEPGAVPDPLPGIGTMAIDGGSTLAAGPGGALPNNLSREVLGFLPYWMLSDSDVTSTMRYDLLSTIAYFDIVLNSDGSIIRSGPGWNGWNSAALTAVMNAAHARGVKVVLTVSMHGWDAVGAARMPTMLNSAANRARAVADIVAQVKSRNADGISLDFEPVPTSLRSQFTTFVREVKAGLVKAGAGSYLTVDTMAGAASWSTGYDVVALTASGAADAIVVMAYDLSWSESARAGGVAPMESPYVFDVTDALDAHLRAGVPPAKMIWGVPYYGRTWPTTSGAMNSTTRDGTSSAWSYNQAVAQASKWGWRWDPVGQVPWYSWQDGGWWQGYYDDQSSLGIKYNLINANRLAGVGIWSLGMDAGRTELWSAIAKGFGRSASRLGGTDRYATAAAVSGAFAPGVPVVYVATGANYPDALAAGPAAVQQKGAILLATRTTLPAATIAALQRLQPKRIVVLGSAGVISESVKAALEGYTSGRVTRIAGPDRYATAVETSEVHFPTASVVYLATGENYPDALAGGVAAAIENGPILLSQTNAIPQVTLDELNRLHPSRIVLLGSAAVMSEAVATAARAISPSVTRLAGANRYATSVEISKSLFTTAGAVYIATGTNFPDGLAAAALAGSARGPLLLINGNAVPPVIMDELRRLDARRIVVIGGPGAISASTLTTLLGF